MITIEVEKDELVLKNGGNQLRLVLPEHLREKAGRGTLALGLIGNPKTGAALIFAGDEPIPVTGDYVPAVPPSSYVQCCDQVTVSDNSIPLDTPYNATATLSGTTGINILTLTIGKPV